MCDRLHILNDKKKVKKVINQEMERGSYTTESIAMFAELALRCVWLNSGERSSMSKCVKELQVIMYTNSKFFCKAYELLIITHAIKFY